MKTWRSAAAALLAGGTLAATAAPATAERLRLNDEAGDTMANGLDITRAAFANRDRAVVVDLKFVSDKPSLVAVLIRARDGSRVWIVSRHARRGPDDTLLAQPRRGEVPCAGLTSDWDRRAAEVRLRMPSRCLDDGNYGATRHWAFIERGDDVDYAPDTPSGNIGVTDWISRG